MKWWFREVPVILAKPFFFGGDPILYNQFTWENELSSANDAVRMRVCTVALCAMLICVLFPSA